MIYHSILFSFCLIGMASADITSCQNMDNKVEVTCKLNEGDQTSCKFTAETVGDKKKLVDNQEQKECKLTLSVDKETNFLVITCSIENPSKSLNKTVDMKNQKACSAGSVLQYAGVSLLLALLAPLLCEML